MCMYVNTTEKNVTTLIMQMWMSLEIESFKYNFKRFQ